MFSRDVGKITQYVDCVNQKAIGHSRLRNNFGSNRRTYSELDNINIPAFVVLHCLLPSKICFCISANMHPYE